MKFHRSQTECLNLISVNVHPYWFMFFVRKDDTSCCVDDHAVERELRFRREECFQGPVPIPSEPAAITQPDDTNKFQRTANLRNLHEQLRLGFRISKLT